MSTRSSATIFVLLACLWVAAGCGRDPEDPANHDGILVNLSDPDSVILQIQVGVAAGSFTSYMNAFAQDFVFRPDPQDSISLSIQNPGVFDHWNYSVEQQVMQQVLGRYAHRQVEFTQGDSTSNEPNVVIIDQFYQLFLDSEQYHGLATFEMRLDSGAWRISQWKDFRFMDPDTTWGVLKAMNR